MVHSSLSRNHFIQPGRRTASGNPVSTAKEARMAGVVELGAHLTTRRFGYVHHGIYVGGGKVIHYAGFSLGLIAGPIEVTSLVSFSGRSGFDVRACPRREFAPESVVARAYSRIGERKYDV